MIYNGCNLVRFLNYSFVIKFIKELKDLIKEVIREKNKPRIDETSSSGSTGGITAKGVTAKQSAGVATAASIIKAGGGTATGAEYAGYSFIAGTGRLCVCS